MDGYSVCSVGRKNSLPLQRTGESAPPSAILRHYRRVRVSESTSSRAHLNPLRKLRAKRNAWTRGGDWFDVGYTHKNTCINMYIEPNSKNPYCMIHE